MRITSLHIDGFGMFADTGFAGFERGVNVLYGQNEDGKTTILEFIRRILFGFPSGRTKQNPYTPQAGGKHGGRLVCEMADGATVTIERYAGPRGGPVTVRHTDGRPETSESLAVLLGRITETVYRNVYAVGLTDLQAAEALEHEEVTGLIYGAGFGLGARALSKTRETLKNRVGGLYRPRRSKQLIRQLLTELSTAEKDIADIGRHLGQFDDLVARRVSLDQEIQGMKARIGELTALRSSLEHRAGLYSHFVKWCDYGKEMAALSDVPDISDEHRRELQELDNARLRFREDASRVEKQSALIGDRLGRLPMNRAILDAEGAVRELVRSTEMYRKAQDDIGAVRQELSAAEASVAGHLSRLGGDWSEEKVHGFHITVEQMTTTDAFRERLGEARQRRERAREAVEDARQQEAIRQGTGRSSSTPVRALALAVAILGTAGAILGVSQSQWPLAGLALAVVAGALMIALRTGGGISSPAEITMDVYQRRHDEAVEEYARLEKEWGRLPASLGLDEALSPDALFAILKEIRGLREAVTNRDRLAERVARMDETIVRVDGKYRDLSSITGVGEGVSTAVSGIELLERALGDEQARSHERRQLEQQAEDLVRERQGIRDGLDENDARREAIIAAVGATDMDDVRRRFERIERRKELAGLLRECEQTMQAVVGTGEAFDRYLQDMRKTTPEEMRQRLDALNVESQEQSHLHDEALKEYQRLTGEIDALASRDDMFEVQEKRETLTSRLADAAEQWAGARIAEAMLDRTVGAYEKNRQPEVIRSASGVFGRITKGRYGAIRKSVEGSDLEIIEGSSGRKKSVDLLSRGTREQLYLSMRLGLIAEYERGAEPLPIILDDVLVNFDDQRGRQTVEALIDFARDRQVLVMTCHRHIYETYRDLGAHPVSLTSL